MINEREGWLQCTCSGFPAPCEPEYQTARSILVFRVVLYNLAVAYHFTDLLDIDSAENTLVDRMPGELKLTLCDLVANLMDSCHAGIISSWYSAMRSRTVRRSRVQRSSCGAPRYFAASLSSALLDEAATRRKCGGNGAERFTLSAAPDLACGRILINRCDLAGERGLHIDREPWLE